MSACRPGGRSPPRRGSTRGSSAAGPTSGRSSRERSPTSSSWTAIPCSTSRRCRTSTWSSRRGSSSRAAPDPMRLGSILRMRCPQCHEGRVFRSLVTMHDSCPSCGCVFEREPGYFVGAMYVSYALAVPLYLLLAGILRLVLRGWSDLAVLALALPLFVPFAPLLFRYSRVIWMHVDRAFDRPNDPARPPR